MTSRTKTWLIYGGLVLLILLLLVGVISVGVITRGGAHNIRPGAETTYITEPINEDGSIDYLTAINQRSSQGVKAAENAAVDLLRAFGPEVLAEDVRPQYYARLGMTPLPLDAPYFVEFEKYAAEQAPLRGPAGDDPQPDDALDADDVASDQFDHCGSHKWTADEYPLIDAWLQVNEEPLRWIVRASQQPGFYQPLLTSNNSRSLIFALIPMVSPERNAVRALCVRATRSWGAGEIDAALDDCLAALRISRLASASPTIVDSLVAIACQRIASITLEQIAASGEASAEVLRDVIARSEQLPPMSPMWNKIESGERYMYLSAATTAAQVGVASLAGDMEAPGAPPPWMLSSDLIDWNVVLREGNRWYDEIVSVGQIANYQQHKQAVAQLAQQMQGLVGQYRNIGRTLGSAATMNGRSQLMADVMAGLMFPAVGAAYQAEYRDTMCWRVTTTSLWLEVYRQEQGTYPETLDQLVPDYLSDVPADLFDNRPIKYRRRGDGYVVYSVGPDETDNGGADLDSSPSGLVGDLAVRVNVADENAVEPAEAQAD